MPQTPQDPIDATFVDVEDDGVPPRVAPNAPAAPAAPSASALLADLLELGGTVAQAGAAVAHQVSPKTAQRATKVGEAAHAGADVVRTGAAAVESIQAETRRVAGPLAAKLREFDQKARAAGIYGQRAAPRGIHRGPPRPVTVKVGGSK